MTFCPLALVHIVSTVWKSQVATKNCKSSHSHPSYRQSGVIQIFFFQTFPKKIILKVSRLSNKGSKKTLPALTNAGTKLFPRMKDIGETEESFETFHSVIKMFWLQTRLEKI